MTNPRAYQALTIATALELWAKARVRVGRAWTPKAMMRAAREITGQEFGQRDYTGAAKALRKAAERLSAGLEAF